MLEGREERRIIRELAIKHKKTEKEIEELICSMYKLGKDSIESGKPIAIRIPFLGIFKPKSDEIIAERGIKRNKDNNG